MHSDNNEIPYNDKSPRVKALRKLHKLYDTHKLSWKLYQVMFSKINKYFPTYYMYAFANDKMKVIFKEYN